MDKFKTILLIVIIAFLVGVLGLGFYYVNAVIEGNKADTHKVENVQDKKPNFEEAKQAEENSNVNEKDLNNDPDNFFKTNDSNGQDESATDGKMTFLKSYSVSQPEDINNESTYFYVMEYMPAKKLSIDKLYLKDNESCPILIADSGAFKMSLYNSSNRTYFKDYNDSDHPMADLNGNLPRLGDFKADKLEKGFIFIGCKINPKKSKIMMKVQNRTEEYPLNF